MTLVTCKECQASISHQANPCPRCGVPDPTVSAEEARLREQYKQWSDEEDRQVALYNDAMKQSFLWFGQKKIQYHVDLANKAQEKAREIRKKLREIEYNKTAGTS